MYEETFGTDWDHLTEDAAIRRAYALGVAASIGEPVPDEYERVVAQPGSAYDQSLVELAYSRGRNRARRERADADSSEQVWASLVEEAADVSDAGDDRESGPGPAADPPSALSDAGPAGKRTEAVELPKFLRREE